MSREEILKAFSIHLRYLRNEKGMSQQQLANEADISKRAIQKIENGMQNPSLTILFALSEALDISICSLIDLSEE
jgi:transcriptional regulator with XRE-family HTH domain